MHWSRAFWHCVGYKFSRASYLLSLLRPQIIKDLELKVQFARTPPPPPSLGTRLMVILGTLRLHPPPTTPDSPAALQLPSILKINLAFNNHVWPMYTLVRT